MRRCLLINLEPAGGGGAYYFGAEFDLEGYFASSHGAGGGYCAGPGALYKTETTSQLPTVHVLASACGRLRSPNQSCSVYQTSIMNIIMCGVYY